MTTSEPFENRTRSSNSKEETKMKETTNSRFSKDFRRAALAIVAIGIAVAPALHAKSNSNKVASKPENVAAHVELSGGPVTRMLLVKKNQTEYLVLGLGSSSTVTLFDVTKPDQPRTIDAAAGVAGAKATELKFVADTLTLFGTSDARSAASSEPREIRSLSGVTAFLKDKTHGLIYATNADGLWIVKTPQRAEDDAEHDEYAIGTY
jgi:hypothetical protein